MASLHRGGLAIQRSPRGRRLQTIQGSAQLAPDQKGIGPRVGGDGAVLTGEADAVGAGAILRIRDLVAMGSGGKQLNRLRFDVSAMEQGTQLPVSTDDRPGLRQHNPEMQATGRWNDHGTAAGILSRTNQGQESGAVACPGRGAGAVVVQIDPT